MLKETNDMRDKTNRQDELESMLDNLRDTLAEQSSKARESGPALAMALNALDAINSAPPDQKAELRARLKERLENAGVIPKAGEEA